MFFCENECSHSTYAHLVPHTINREKFITNSCFSCSMYHFALCALVHHHLVRTHFDSLCTCTSVAVVMQKLFRLGLMWFMLSAAHSEPTSPSIDGVEWESKTHAANWNKLAELRSFVRCFCLFPHNKIESKWKLCCWRDFHSHFIASHYILVSIQCRASDEL